jgi:hypothetical protein
VIELKPLDPLQATSIWDWVRVGLAHTIDKAGGHYRPEDIYIRIRAGSAWLYLVVVDGRDIGFMVLTQEYDPDGLVLFIWALWCRPGSAAPYKHEIYAEIDKLAAAVKAKRIRWWSPLRGWERERFGHKVAVVFEREVGNAIIP